MAGTAALARQPRHRPLRRLAWGVSDRRHFKSFRRVVARLKGGPSAAVLPLVGVSSRKLPGARQAKITRAGLFGRLNLRCWRFVSPASGRSANSPGGSHLARVERRCRFSPGDGVPRAIFLIQLPGLADPGRRAGDVRRRLLEDSAARFLFPRRALALRNLFREFCDQAGSQASQPSPARVAFRCSRHVNEHARESFHEAGQAFRGLGNYVHRYR